MALRELIELKGSWPLETGLTISNFTITAQILARSLANFYRQKADRHKFIIYALR